MRPSLPLLRAVAAVSLLILGARPAHATPAAGPPSDGAVPPLPTPLAAAEALDPAGVATPLRPGAEAIVDPASTFRVVLPGRSEDARLSLLDAADALLPATTTREVGERTVLTVAPREPLVPASHYVLRIDGARGRDLHDAAGRPAGPVDLHLVAAGAPPEPPKKASPRARRRR